MAFILSKIRDSQVARFIIIGILNTLVDFTVLNLLLYIFRDAGLEVYPFLKSVSFIAAVTNSYLFNKYWVFLAHSKPTFNESGKFFATNIFGLFINSLFANFALGALLFVFADSISKILIANLAALCGSVAVAVMNFLSYKHFVFRKTKDAE